MALDSAVRIHAMPLLTLFQMLLPTCSAVLHEDNQAALQIVRSGRNPTLRHLRRTHKVCITWLCEALQQLDICVLYDKSSNQAADVFTKPFINVRKWTHARRLLGMGVRGGLSELIRERGETFCMPDTQDAPISRRLPHCVHPRRAS